MRNINKYSSISLVVILLALAGCTGEADLDKTVGDGNSPADGTPLIVRATASGFQLPEQSGGSPATRTPLEDGLTTTFQTGDAIGLFCIRSAADGSTSIPEGMRNVKLVCTQASDGTNVWKTEDGADGPVYYTDAQTYVAYYPFKTGLSTIANDEQALRAELLAIEPLEDQSTPENLTASDLMIASGSPVTASGKQTLTLNFKHANVLLVIKPMSMNHCIAPAGVSTYSYHAEAKAWGIDKSITKSTAVDGNSSVTCKMLISGFIQACEMSDGSYRAIIPDPQGLVDQIRCSYTTNDGTSPLLVSVTGTAITGGIKANTCYTLEIHSNSAKAGEVVRAVQPGDFVFQHNSKIEIYPGDGAVDAGGKIPDYAKAVGIVVTADPTRMTDLRCNSGGWNHAYVMGLENIPNGPYQWAKEASLSTPLPGISVDIAENDMNGYTETELMLVQSPLSNFPIFEALKKYRTDNPVPNGINRSPWFIPSIGQWFDVMTNICGTSPNDFPTREFYIWMTSKEQRIEMIAKADNQLAKVGTTLLMLPSHDIYETNIWLSSQTNYTNYGNKINAWEFYGTDRTGIFSIEELGKTYDCHARPFFAF